MAHSQSIRKGQFPIICQICENDTRIKWKCLECDKLMCDNCKVKIHPKFAKDHRIIDIKEVGLHTVERKLDFSQTKCKQHPGQVCCLFCTTCDHIVCPVCVSKIHKKHDLVEISEGYEMKVEGLKKRLIKLERNEVDLNKDTSELETIKTSENIKYVDVNKSIIDQEIAVKKSVEQNAKNLQSKLDVKWKTIQQVIEQDIDKNGRQKNQLKEKINEIEDLIKSTDISTFFEEIVVISERSPDEVIPPRKINHTSIPSFIPDDLTKYTVGRLQPDSTNKQKVSEIKIRVKKEYITALPAIHSIAPCLDDSLWICYNLSPGVSQNIEVKGGNLSVMSRFDIRAYGMAFLPSGVLLMATGESKLKQISKDKKTLTDTKYSVSPLSLCAVHVTQDNKIVVGASGNERRVVIIMDMNGEHEMVYENDRYNKPIFVYPRCIKGTNNNHIFVADYSTTKDKSGNVYVLDQGGNILNSYTGPGAQIQDEQSIFRPICIEVTPSDKVIVVDMDKKYLHILDDSGELIMCYNTKDVGIILPYSVGMDRTGKFYIGCSSKKNSSDNALLYQVDISGV